VCCDEKGVAAFQLLRHRRTEPQAFLYAFDLLELNGDDLRRERIEVRKATLASILRKSRPGVRLNQHLEHPGRPDGLPAAPARWG
jgi:bifunctional non-homologous end joining protein LigD